MYKYLETMLIVFVLLSLNIFGHEYTHVALNNYRLDNVCILNCEPMENKGILGNNYTPIGVYLSEPINPIAKDEVVASVGGLLTMFSVVGLTKVVNK